jgi:siroheme synthase-like protein
MKMHKFPLFIDLSGRKILIVGAGSIAFRRVNTLLMYGADVTVVAPKICDNINDLARDGKITLLSRQFCREDVTDKFMVIAATDDGELNSQVTSYARACGAIANNASDRSDCDFFFPAVIVSDKLSIGVCGTGDDHSAVAKAAGEIREKYSSK